MAEKGGWMAGGPAVVSVGPRGPTKVDGLGMRRRSLIGWRNT